MTPPRDRRLRNLATLLRSPRLGLIVVLVMANSVAACDPYDGATGLNVLNNLAETVRMTYVVSGVEMSLADDIDGDVIRPGETKRFRLDLYDPGGDTSGCSIGDLVARTEQGREVARIHPPQCIGGNPRLSDWSPGRQ